MFNILPNGHAELTEPLSVNVWTQGGIVVRVDVPKGFVSDGASIPSMLWPVFGPPVGSDHFRAAVVHDYLCEHATTYRQRLLGDAVFFSLLDEAGVPVWKRSAMYLGVRAYAKIAWCDSSACQWIRSALGIAKRGDK